MATIPFWLCVLLSSCVTSFASRTASIKATQTHVVRRRRLEGGGSNDSPRASIVHERRLEEDRWRLLPPAVPKMCLFVTGHSWDHYLIFAMHELNSGDFYADELRGLALPIDFELLKADPTGTFVAGEVQHVYDAHRESCSIVVGPAWTNQLSAIGEWASLQGQAVVTGGANSPKFSQPNFATVSRVIPSDLGVLKALVEILEYYDLRQINICHFNDEYGRAVTEEMIRKSEGRIQVVVTASWNAGSSDEAFDFIMDRLESSATRVTLVAATALEATPFLNRAGARGLFDTHIWVGPAMDQVISDLVVQPKGGMWGVTYAPDLTADDPLAQRYLAKDLAPHRAVFEAGILGDDWEELTSWGAYAYDAVVAAASALARVHSTGYNYTGLDIVQELRRPNVQLEGSTGLLQMDEVGDRVGARIPILSVTNRTTELFAVFEEGVGLKILQDPLWPGGATTQPDDLIRSPQSDSKRSNTIILSTVIPLMALLLAISIGLYYYLHKSRGKIRDVRQAPKEGPCCLVFTDIESSSTLWGVTPTAMSEAIDIHHAVIRDCLTKFRGYEVKTIGDSFMIAVASSEDALGLVVELQTKLFQSKWDSSIDSAYLDMLQKKDDASEPRTSKGLWSGLRVRASVHYGQPEIVLDEVTKGYDYYGTVVNEAARIEALAHGGQTVVSEAFKQSLPMVPNHVEFVPMGPHELRGCPGQTNLWQLTPKNFEGRSFPPLRTDTQNDEKEGVDDNAWTGANMSQRSLDISSVCSSLGDVEEVHETWFYTLYSIFTPAKRKDLLKPLHAAWRVRSDEQLIRRVSRANRAKQRSQQAKSSNGSFRLNNGRILSRKEPESSAVPNKPPLTTAKLPLALDVAPRPIKASVRTNMTGGVDDSMEKGFTPIRPMRNRLSFVAETPTEYSESSSYVDDGASNPRNSEEFLLDQPAAKQSESLVSLSEN